MDIAEIKQRVIILRELLRNHNIHSDGVILFGSYAKRMETAESDIDIAVVSRDFGVDRFAESSLLNRLAFSCLPNCDAIPIGLKDYLEESPISPILHEIKKDGLLLF